MPILDNPKHEMFAVEIAKGANQTEAAIKAGYSVPRARFTGRDLATNRHIQARIEQLRRNIVEISQVTVTYNAAIWLQRLVELVELKYSDYEKPREEWTEAMWRWAEVEDVYQRSNDGVQEGQSRSWDKVGVRIKITNRDKLKALELIGKSKIVDAMVKQGTDAREIAGEVMNEIDKRISEGRRRASEYAMKPALETRSITEGQPQSVVECINIQAQAIERDEESTRCGDGDRS